TGEDCAASHDGSRLRRLQAVQAPVSWRAGDPVANSRARTVFPVARPLIGRVGGDGVSMGGQALEIVAVE
ncbi:MAG: hypothetical protein ACYC10_21185, partial [Allorhizobium sp.]